MKRRPPGRLRLAGTNGSGVDVLRAALGRRSFGRSRLAGIDADAARISAALLGLGSPRRWRRHCPARLESTKAVVAAGVANTGSWLLVLVTAIIAVVDATETTTIPATFAAVTLFGAAAPAFTAQERPFVLFSLVRRPFLRCRAVILREVHPAQLLGEAVRTRGHEHLPAPAEEPPLAEADVWVTDAPPLGIELLVLVKHRT